MHRDQRTRAVVAPGIALTVALPLLTILAGCNKAPEPKALEEIQTRGELRVVTVNSPTSYYLGTHGAEGLEFGLARAYARKLGVTLVITPVANAAAMQVELAAGNADIAAAQLSADEAWLKAGNAAKPYEQVEQLVVYRRGETRPRGTIQLESARLAVRAGSPQERVLQKLKSTVAPNIEWVGTAPSSADPLEDVESGQANYAIVDTREYSFAKHLYPNVAEGFTLPATRPAQWIVRNQAPDLLRSVNDFFDEIAHSGLLATLSESASGDARRFEYLESREFQAHIAIRLGAFRQFFEDASTRSGVDWRLIAAIGYQESHWDAKATSPTGVRGLMMLTEETADRLQIKDRLDARESVLGGARYLALLKESLPPRLSEPDRTYLALAAYNIGIGHLEDARILAQKANLNPDKWQDVRQVISRLAEPDSFQSLKHGYARGGEAMQLVDNIRNYYDILTRMEPRDAPMLPTAAEPQASSKGSAPGK